MIRPPLLDLNSVELKYHPFKIWLHKCTGSCTVLSPKIWVSKEAKDIHVKVFNRITNKNEAKPMEKHISCDFKCKFNSTTCNSKKILLEILEHLFVRTASMEKVLLIL